MEKAAGGLIAVTAGDPYGIGPEVALKSLDEAPPARCVLIGDYGILEQTARSLGTRVPLERVRDAARARRIEAAVPVIDPGPGGLDVTKTGRMESRAGVAALSWIDRAAQLVLAGQADALVTGPVSKEAVALAGRSDFTGHTEYLREKTGAEHAVMLFDAGEFKVALVTAHVALREVFDLVTAERVLRTLRIVNDALRRDFAVEKPRLALAGLNPHAGEGGRFGDEEKKVLVPALERARRAGIAVDGPLPGDVVFWQARRGGCDAVVSLYHDQGLVAVKTVAFDRAVNVTLGLPIVRTSVDHGTAFDIAGKGIADPGSMRAAIALARRIVVNRAKAGGD